MKKELKYAEISIILEQTKKAIFDNVPGFRNSLKDALNNLINIFEIVENERKSIFDKYVNKDKNGNPIAKKGIDNPVSLKEFTFLDEDKFNKEVTKLANKVIAIEFKTIDQDKEFVILKSGEKISVKEFLNNSESITTTTALFLTKYFTNE